MIRKCKCGAVLQTQGIISCPNARLWNFWKHKEDWNHLLTPAKREELNGLYQEIVKSDYRENMQRLFSASPEELGKVAVKQAKKGYR